jgi:hypothetical protein
LLSRDNDHHEVEIFEGDLVGSHGTELNLRVLPHAFARG